MEVGAVKQAFNNEVIHLKKSLNQAKIHTIHKLTRKAKTFNTKKSSDKIKDKLKRKAESAVNEVLIIKKIKPRDVARFIVTHKDNINDYINKPDVDQNKACARLLLHKAMQDKYKTIRDRFGNIPINDLLMSRHERRKLKKEMKEKQANKKKGKNKAEADKTQVKKGEIAKDISVDDGSILSNDDNSSDGMSEDSDNELVEDNANSNDENDLSNDESAIPNLNKDDEMESSEENDEGKSDGDMDDGETSSIEEEVPPKDDKEDRLEIFVKPTQIISNNVTTKANKALIQNKTKKSEKRKENKNKNINEKILKRNFNKHEDETPKAVKIVDPFFKTSSGANYMSLAEPRAPDEVKEAHKQGNRQYRRAVMFGHVPKSKPRNFNKDNNFKQPHRFNRNNDTDNKTDRFNKNSNYNSFSNDRKNKFNNDTPKDQVPEKPEKLHPSWEAKKKLSSVLPFQGKKIKFDDS